MRTVFHGALLVAYIVAGTWLALDHFVTPLVGWAKALGAVSVPCVIESSVTRQEGPGRTARFEVEIRFRYTLGHKEYQSSNYRFLHRSYARRAQAHAFCAAYPPGEHTECWVDPEQPDSAVLERHLPPEIVSGAYCMLAVAFGFAGVWGWGRGRLEETATDALRPVSSRQDAFAGATLMALLFGATAGLFGIDAARDLRDRAVDLETFVGLACVAVALAMLWLAAKATRALISPVPLLKLDPKPMVPGVPSRLAWDVRYLPRGSQEMLVELVGGEQRTSSRSVTFWPFHEAVIARVPDVRRAPTGEASLLIPAGAKPTTDAARVRDMWLVLVRFPGTRDGDHSFEVRVEQAR